LSISPPAKRPSRFIYIASLEEDAGAGFEDSGARSRAPDQRSCTGLFRKNFRMSGRNFSIISRFRSRGGLASAGGSEKDCVPLVWSSNWALALARRSGDIIRSSTDAASALYSSEKFPDPETGGRRARRAQGHTAWPGAC